MFNINDPYNLPPFLDQNVPGYLFDEDNWLPPTDDEIFGYLEYEREMLEEEFGDELQYVQAEAEAYAEYEEYLAEEAA